MQWLETSQWLNVALAALLGPGLSRLLYLYALKRLELIKTTLIGEVEPVLTALMSFLALREIPSFEEWTGGSLMLAACLILISECASYRATQVEFPKERVEFPKETRGNRMNSLMRISALTPPWLADEVY